MQLRDESQKSLPSPSSVFEGFISVQSCQINGPCTVDTVSYYRTDEDELRKACKTTRKRSRLPFDLWRPILQSEFRCNVGNIAQSLRAALLHPCVKH